MANYIQEGRVINYRNDGAGDIKYGDPVVLTEIIGVATMDIPAGGLGTVELGGVYEIEAETTATFAVGQEVYWDTASECLTATKTDAGAIRAGRITEAKAQSTASACVKLGG